MRNRQEMIAYALEIDPALLPYVPELLADLEELGSDAEWIVEVLEALELPDATTVVDLGCGKGAVSVEIADELDFTVTGIELFEPFIESCEALAESTGVAELCEFRHGDVLEMAATTGPFDVAVYAALGDVLGGPDETVRAIRQYVKPGGFMIISDLYLVEGGSRDFPGFERYSDQDATAALLTAHGDTLEKVVTATDDDDEEDDVDEGALIRQRAEALAQRFPAQREGLLAFADDQAAENAFIDSNLVDAIWVLRRC